MSYQPPGWGPPGPPGAPNYQQPPYGYPPGCEWAARALARNAAMVADVARRGNARCVALLAPWSRTRGTQHTMRLAREHGIAVEVLACPAEHGPRGAR